MSVPVVGEIKVRGTVRGELWRLADRASHRTDPRASYELHAALEAAEYEDSGYPVKLTQRARDLILEQAPWLAARSPDVFGEVPNGGEVPRGGVHTDHGIAELCRQKLVEDVIIVRSGTSRIASVTVELKGGDKLEFNLPFGFHYKSRPPRPSEVAMARAERARAARS